MRDLPLTSGDSVKRGTSECQSIKIAIWIKLVLLAVSEVGLWLPSRGVVVDSMIVYGCSGTFLGDSMDWVSSEVEIWVKNVDWRHKNEGNVCFCFWFWTDKGERWKERSSGLFDVIWLFYDLSVLLKTDLVQRIMIHSWNVSDLNSK